MDDNKEKQDLEKQDLENPARKFSTNFKVIKKIKMIKKIK